MDVTVSVVLPVYNRPDKLPAAMRSVLDQSFRDLELIVVDDASAVDLGPVARGLGDPRVRYIRRERNGGAGAARNTGIAAARGRLIAFQDSDDLWFPGKLAAQVALIDAQPPGTGVVTGGKVIYGRDAGFRFGEGLVSYAPPPARLLRPGEDQLRRMLEENRLSVQNALFRRDCLPDPAWFDELLRADEDWDLALRLARRTRILEVLVPVVMCFKSDDSISRNRRRTVMARARVLAKNRDLAAAYPREWGAAVWRLGTMLHRLGRRRAGRRFMRAGAFRNPAVLLGALARRLGR